MDPLIADGLARFEPVMAKLAAELARSHRLTRASVLAACQAAGEPDMSNAFDARLLEDVLRRASFLASLERYPARRFTLEELAFVSGTVGNVHIPQRLTFENCEIFSPLADQPAVVTFKDVSLLAFEWQSNGAPSGGLHLDDAVIEQAVWVRNLRSKAGVILDDVRAGHDIDISASGVAYEESVFGPVVTLRSVVIAGQLKLQACSKDFGVLVERCSIGRRVTISTIDREREINRALVVRDAEVGGDMNIEVQNAALIHLDDVAVEGDLIVGHDDNSRGEGFPVVIDRVRVGLGLRLQGLRFRAPPIGSREGSIVAGGTEDRGVGLFVGATRAKADLSIARCAMISMDQEQVGSTLLPAVADLRSVQVGGDLTITADASWGDIVLQDPSVDGILRIDGSESKHQVGRLQARNARLGGFEAKRCRFVAQGDEPTVEMQRATIAGDFLFHEQVKTRAISVEEAKIGGMASIGGGSTDRFFARSARIERFELGNETDLSLREIDLTNTRVTSFVFDPSAFVPVALQEKKHKAAAPHSEATPTNREFKAEGFHFDFVVERGSGIQLYARLAFLESASTKNDGKSINGQLWARYSEALFNQGDEHGGQAVARERKVRLSQQAPFSERVFTRAIQALGDFGYNPMLAARWFLLAWLSSAIIFAFASNIEVVRTDCGLCVGAFTPRVAADYRGDGPEGKATYPRFDPVLYALDVLLPFVDLSMESHWRPDTRGAETGWTTTDGIVLNWIVSLGTLFGGLLVTIMVAGLAGYLRRSDGRM